MAITWGTVKSLLLFFGPILLPKAISYYRSLRAAPSIHGVPIRPIPSNVLRSLFLLSLVASVFIIRCLPSFATEDIFHITQSRLQTPTDVLFTRLSAIRPHGLTPVDDSLRSKINSMESRLLFFQYGPDVITNCHFCKPEDPNSYLYYALPGLAGPHLLNLVILALITSSLFTGTEGRKWRVSATIAAGAIALGELYLVATYSYQDNSRAARLEDIDFFYASMRIYRNLSIALIDIILITALYLSSTHRFFISPPSPASSIETSLRILDSARSKMAATGILRNTINRDEELRNKGMAYWRHEVGLTSAVMEEREVVDSVNNAMESRRLDIVSISRDAAMYAENIIMPIQGAGPGV